MNRPSTHRTQSFRLCLLPSAFCLLLTLSASAADSITRKHGEGKAAGTITGMSKTEVTVKPITGSEIKVPANDIAAIEWDAAPAGLNLAYSLEKSGNLTEALSRFTKALGDVKSGNENLKADIEYAIARITAKLALTDAGQRDEASKKLQAFVKAHPDNYNYYDAFNWLGRIDLARRNFAEAQEAFNTLAQAPWPDYKMAARVAAGRIAMAENKPDVAVQAFDEVIHAPAKTPAEEARRYEAMIGKAKGLIQQNQQEQALGLLTEVIDKAPADNAPIQAQAWVLQGDALQALNRAKEALLAYLHVDVLYPGESALHAEALYHLNHLSKALQHPDRAADAQAKLVSQYPNSEWTKKLTAGTE